MEDIRGLVGLIGRSVVVAAGYVLSIIGFGIVAGAMGVQVEAPAGSERMLVWLFLSGFLLAILLGQFASQMMAGRDRHLAVWFSVIFFNMGSVAIEGAFFAPDLIRMPLAVLAVQQLVSSAVAAILITLLYASTGRSTTLGTQLQERPWYAWIGRFLAASLVYLIAYFVFGALNYSLVTGPYYSAHAGGLTVPPPQVVLAVELVRAPLIVFSIALFVLTYRAPRRRLAGLSGLMLFWVGGVVPLFLQISALPLILIAASALEIFFQNLITGAVAALLLSLREDETRFSIAHAQEP